MRLPGVYLFTCYGALTSGFLQNSLHVPRKITGLDKGAGLEYKIISKPVAVDKTTYHVSSTDLSMAFDLKDVKDTNMFDGPLALAKERDACGVGFIANTRSGGTYYAMKQP
jgi:hypothetical protein